MAPRRGWSLGGFARRSRALRCRLLSWDHLALGQLGVVGFLCSFVAAGCADGDGAQARADAGGDSGRGRAAPVGAAGGRLLAAGLLCELGQVDGDLSLEDPAEVVDRRVAEAHASELKVGRAEARSAEVEGGVLAHQRRPRLVLAADIAAHGDAEIEVEAHALELE